MDPAVARASPPAAVLFEDGLGVRRQVVDQTTTETLEMLCLRGDLTSVPSFEFALRERVSRLANFRHAYYGRVRRVDRLTDPASSLAIVSECTAGARLSEILRVAERRRLALDINAALCLIRQLVPAVAMLHQNVRDVAHGALGPERVVVTPHARLVIVDYVLGAALEQLRYSHERYWKEFRIALPRSAGLPRFDHRADVTQVGVIALSLILGRPLRDEEYPARIGGLVASASAMSALGGREPVTPALRLWLSRTLQVDLRDSFTSALEAQAALDEVLSDDSGYIAAPVALEAFLGRYHACAELPHTPAPAATPSHPSSLSDFKPPPTGEARRPRPTVQEGQPERRSSQLDLRPVQADVRSVRTSAPVAPVELAPMADSIDAMDRPTLDKVQVAPTAPRSVDSPTARAKLLPQEPVFPTPPMESLRPAVALPPPVHSTLPHVDQHSEKPRRTWRRLIAAALVLVAVAGVGMFAAYYYGSPAPIGASVGTLMVESNPAGVQVLVDGEARGMTPVTLTLKAGAHVLELRGAGEPRVIPLTVPAGSQVSQYIELPKTGPSPGQLQVRTDPAGARVSVDGQPRGISPITIGELPPGEHEILLESDLGSVRQRVTIEAGATSSLLVPLAAPAGAPLLGWVSVSAPFEVQIFEEGRLLGTSQSDRIMVEAGRHDIEVVNETLSYRATRTVQVTPGRIAAVALVLPKGTLSLNANPWAEVWIDGERVGETPMGNLAISIGPHEIVFRHPELGEQRHALTVTMAGSARLSVDMRKK